MGDDITIGVTEIVNNIEVTAQPNDQIVDISVIDNTDEVTLNITPTVIEINVNKGSSFAKWGDILGTLSDQEDLQDALDLKADLVDGKVPSSQLPSYVDDVIEVANYAALPVTGESGKIYITIDNNHIFRWTGSIYVEITDNTAVWGAITGTLSSQTDLVTALNLRVPYTGATGNVNLGEYGLTAGFLGLDTTPTSTPTGVGTIFWDSANRTAALIDGDGDTTLQIGQEQRILVHNNTGSTLTDGQVVYVTGSTGNLPSVSLANATSETTSAATIGVVTESIAHGADGFITTSGIINGLNTLDFDEGDLLWLSTTAGAFTTTKPTSPAHLVLIGYVIKKAGGNGSILVKIQNTQELSESSDVLFTSLTDKDVLTYESSSQLWKNKSISTILGYTPANDSSVVHKTGDETISGRKTFNSTTDIGIRSNISGNGYGIYSENSSNGISFYVANNGSGKAFSVSNTLGSFGNMYEGSYNGTSNFAVNYLGEITGTKFIKSGGTSSQFLKADGSVDTNTYLQSVAATLPLGSTGGTSPVISITQATTSSNGYLSSTDWNTFNGKQSALNGTGFVKASGTTISYDNSNYALDSVVVKLTGNQTIAGLKTFSGAIVANSQINLGLGSPIYFADSTNTQVAVIRNTSSNGTTLGFTSSLSTFSGNINALSFIKNGGTSSQYLMADGSVSTLINPITGTGTTNYLPKFTGASSLGNSLIYDNGTNVGIGTPAPSALFHVNTSANDPVLISNTGASSYNSLILSNNNNYKVAIGIGGGSVGGNLQDNGFIGTISNRDFLINTNNTERMRITSSGNVGIGTTSPGEKLEVQNGASGAKIKVSNSGGGYASLECSSNASSVALLNFTNQLSLIGGNVGIGTTAPGFKLQVNAEGAGIVHTDGTRIFATYLDSSGVWVGSRSNHNFNLYTNNGSAQVTLTTTGNVGIGTTSPSFQLQLSNDSAAKPGSPLWTVSSDIRIKENVRPYTDGIEKLMQVNPVYYDYNGKAGFSITKDNVGIIAQEMQEVLPNTIKTFKAKLNDDDEEETELLSFNANEIIYVLINSVKELKAEIEILKNK